MSRRSTAAIVDAARILLVDDNRSGLLARRAVLEELGYRTDGAPDGSAALKMFDQQHYDLVVTDFRMPDMDGCELIAQLRTRRPDLPVILISGFADVLGLNEQTTGANMVIMKSANEVQHLIRSAGRLLKLPRKPVASERVLGTTRRKAASH